MKKALIVVVIIGLLLLGSMSVTVSAIHPETNHKKFFKPTDVPVAYDWHYLTPKDAERMAEIANRIDDSGTVVVDGHFAGYKPPTAQETSSAVGKLRVINSIALPRDGSLPTKIDLSQDPRFPHVGDQGHQGSCAAWAVTYYSEGWLQAYLHNWTDAHYGSNKSHLMSPAWTYNKVNGGSDSGSSFVSNMMVLYILGGATMYTMPYNDRDPVSWGDEAAWLEAPKYRIADGYELNVSAIINTTTGTSNPPTQQQVENLTNAIKSILAEGYTINFAIDADQYDSIFQNGGNFIISYSEYDASGSINHAQTIVGYNDSITDNGDKGAFKVVNSWGAGWGKNGYYWITYKAMYKILAMGEGYPYAFFIEPRINYQPKLLAVWSLDPNYRGTRITPIDLGLGSPSNPIQIEESIFGSVLTYNGGDHPFPPFLAVDLTDFMGNVTMNGTNEFFLYAHKWSKKMVINSFNVEYFNKKYTPYEPYQISPNSPDVPATQSSSQSAIVRAYLRPIQPFHTIKINSNADFTQDNGVIAGNGSKENPYVIGWWDIDAHGSNYAIYIGNTTAYFVIENSYLHNTSDGVGLYLSNVTNGYIMKNKFYDNYYGAKFSKSYNNTLADNQFLNNTHPIYIAYSTNLLYYSLNIYPNNTVMGKPLYYVFGRDIMLKDVDAGFIGVYQSKNITLTNVTLNGTDEIFIEDSSNVNLLYSLVNNSRWGVVIRYSSNVKVFGNSFNHNEYGVEAYKTSDSVINNNTVTGNYYGVKLVNSHNVTVYHNNFVSNVHQAYDNQNNTWALTPPAGGNYWSDYNGTDADHDGFGDTPYVIPGGSAKDYYPLTKAWDDVCPSVSISSPKNGKIFAASSVTVYWNGTDNIGIAHYEVKIDSGQWENVGNVTHYTFTGLGDGQHTACVRAFDFSGNNATADVSFNVDTTPPVIQIVAPTDNSYVNTSDVLIKWTAQDQNNVGFMISIDNGLPMSTGSNTEYMAKDLRDGTHKVSITGMDAAGNKNSVDVSFTVDTVKPTVEWNMSISDGAWINTTSLTLKWISTDNCDLNYSEISIDNGNWINIGNVMSYTIKNLSDGSHKVTLRVYDKAGNYNETSFSFNMDTSAPTISITAPENNMITNKSSIQVQWSGKDNIGIAYYEIKVDNGTWKKIENVTAYTLNLQDGHHTIYVKAIDRAGNCKSTEISVTVDTQTPTVQINSPTPNTNITAKYVVVSWSGSDNMGIAYYEVKIDNGTWTKVETNTNYNFTDLKVGSHTVYVKAVDKAGNSQITSVTFNVKEVSTGLNSGVIIGISILIIIIIIVLIAIAMTKSKVNKSKREKEEITEEEKPEEEEEEIAEETSEEESEEENTEE